MGFLRSTGPWKASGRRIIQKQCPDVTIAIAYKWGDSELLAAAPEMAAALKMLLMNRDDVKGLQHAMLAASIALEKAGEL